jgi:hypothetical protein
VLTTLLLSLDSVITLLSLTHPRPRLVQSKYLNSLPTGGYASTIARASSCLYSTLIH